MEPDKNTPPASGEQPGQPNQAQQTPADALSRTPEDLGEDQAAQAAASSATPAVPGEKKISPIKRFFRKVNLYFLIFLLIVAVAGAIMVVNYLNSQKAAPEPNVTTQSLSQDALKQLANTDASVGNSSQTLTIQGNTIIDGQSLMRGNLNVAGNFQSGGGITGPSITVSGAANLGTAQINSLQVASNTAIQGSTTLRDLNVAGTTSLSGAVTASQITVSRLILSGNAVLQIPNHISFTGPSPGRSIGNALGAGGSASINGSDTTGTVNINTGGSPAPGCFVTITFSQHFTNQPHVIVTPVGAAAGQIQWYVGNRSTSGFSVCTNTGAPANQVFAFDYFVTN